MQNQTRRRPMTASEPTNLDNFRAAANRLAAKRPLRNRRLQEIAEAVRNGQTDAAHNALSAHLQKFPKDADALALMGQTLIRLNRKREAADTFAQCLEVAPDFEAARYEYARLLKDLEKLDSSLAEFDRLLAKDSRNPIYRQLKANILQSTGDNEMALVICEELASENPNRADSWISYGHALRAMGNQPECITAYRKAIACKPDCGMAYWSLANLKTVRFSEADIDAMQQQLARTDITPDDRGILLFCLGKAFEDLGIYDRSFEYYAKTNAAKRLDVGYDPDSLSAFVAANKALYTPAFLRNRAGMGCAAPDPIFIVGRSRSGSTLVEQILSSHSAIEGTAELPYIQSMARTLGSVEEGSLFGTRYLKALETLDRTELAKLGEAYLESAGTHRKLDRPFFIDKKPGNVAHVGFIHLILPNAKIIDVRRHPAANGLSMFKLFSPRGKGRLRLTELGRFYRDYVELMAHFDSVLPGKVHRIIYEHLVVDFEAEVRRLLDYLGLPFEDNCMRFYETRRTVLTPSSEQVRKPISGESVDHWKNFEPWLGPLIKSLGSAFTQYPDVPDDLR